jgi:hypothetical protein
MLAVSGPIPFKVPDASRCVVTNDVRFSSRTWTDPQNDRSRCNNVRPQRSRARRIQTDNSALSDYTYFLDDVKIYNQLVVST